MNNTEKFNQMIVQADGTFNGSINLAAGNLTFTALIDNDWVQVRIDSRHTWETFTIGTVTPGWESRLLDWMNATVQLMDPAQVADLPTGEFSEDMDGPDCSCPDLHFTLCPACDPDHPEHTR